MSNDSNDSNDNPNPEPINRVLSPDAVRALASHQQIKIASGVIRSRIVEIIDELLLAHPGLEGLLAAALDGASQEVRALHEQRMRAARAQQPKDGTSVDR